MPYSSNNPESLPPSIPEALMEGDVDVAGKIEAKEKQYHTDFAQIETTTKQAIALIEELSTLQHEGAPHQVLQELKVKIDALYAEADAIFPSKDIVAYDKEITELKTLLSTIRGMTRFLTSEEN